MQVVKTDETLSLSQRLRTSSQDAHTRTESFGFIKKLFQGKCSSEEYWLYLWALRKVYISLEAALEFHKSHPIVSQVYFPELLRLESLNQDLQEWGQPQWAAPMELVTAVTNYCDYINDLQANSPHKLVAHAYVRHLGDLSGGQILGKVLKQRFPNSKGLNFYNFPIADAKSTKELYRERLDKIGSIIPEEEAESICHEASKAFDFNGRIFEVLGTHTEEEAEIKA